MPKYPEYQPMFQSDNTICFPSVAFGDEAERRCFLCDVPVAWVVDEFSFPEPDERASSMPDNMLPAGKNDVLLLVLLAPTGTISGIAYPCK